MKKFKCLWSKTYITSGEVVVEAESAEEAYSMVDESIGDYSGRKQYIPNQNEIMGLEEL